jgi:hypothetical protein
MSLLIQPKDVLFEMFDELRAQATTLNPWDCDRRTQWFDHCRDLLAEVPDPTQRMAWGYYLAQDFSRRMPVSPELVLGWLRQGEPR